MSDYEPIVQDARRQLAHRKLTKAERVALQRRLERIKQQRHVRASGNGMTTYRTRAEAETAAIRRSVLHDQTQYVYSMVVWVVTNSIDEASQHEDAEVVLAKRAE